MAIGPCGWEWDRFEGSPEALGYARRDLPVLEKVLTATPKRQVAVQAGGNLGIWPKRLAQVFHTVYTFEPIPETYRKLLANAPEPNIIAACAALDEVARTVSMSTQRREIHTPRRISHEGVAHVDTIDGVIPTLRIDDLLLPVCDLLYLDIEGWELHALRGAHDTLNRCRPVVAVEINQHLGYAGHTPEDLREFLNKRQYRSLFTMRADEVFVPKEWLV